MDCKNAEKLLARMIFGELDDKQTKELSEHLAGCPACSEALAAMRRAAYLLREGLEAEPVRVLSPERREALLHAVSEPKKTRPVRRFLIGRRDTVPLWKSLTGVAAGLILFLFLAGLAIPSLLRSRVAAPRRVETEIVAKLERREEPKYTPESKSRAIATGSERVFGGVDVEAPRFDWNGDEVTVTDGTVRRKVPLFADRQIAQGPPPPVAKPSPEPPVVVWDDSSDGDEVGGEINRIAKGYAGRVAERKGEIVTVDLFSRAPDVYSNEVSARGLDLGKEAAIAWRDGSGRGKGGRTALSIDGSISLMEPGREEPEDLTIAAGVMNVDYSLRDDGKPGKTEYGTKKLKLGKKFDDHFETDDDMEISETAKGFEDADSVGVIGGPGGKVSGRYGFRTGGAKRSGPMRAGRTKDIDGDKRDKSVVLAIASTDGGVTWGAVPANGPARPSAKIEAGPGRSRRIKEKLDIPLSETVNALGSTITAGGQTIEYSLRDYDKGGGEKDEEAPAGSRDLSRSPRMQAALSLLGRETEESKKEKPSADSRRRALEILDRENKLAKISDKRDAFLSAHHVKAANELAGKADFEKARAGYRKALELDPGSHEALLGLERSTAMADVRKARIPEYARREFEMKKADMDRARLEMERLHKEGKELAVNGDLNGALRKFNALEEIARWMPHKEDLSEYGKDAKDLLARAVEEKEKREKKEYAQRKELETAREKLAEYRNIAQKVKEAGVELIEDEKDRETDDWAVVGEDDARKTTTAQELEKVTKEVRRYEEMLVKVQDIKIRAQFIDIGDEFLEDLGIHLEKSERAGEDDIPQRPVFRAVPVNPFVMTEKDRLSTFSLDVDTASYALARNYVRKGYLPPAASVRMEEFVNAFDYNYPRRTDRVFTVHTKAAPSPFGSGLTLLKIGVRGRVLGREGRKAAHLVFVVDASGSMGRNDRMPLVQYALAALTGQLKHQDRVSLVTYGTASRLVLEAVPAAKKKEIVKAVRSIQCGGSTNLIEGLELGYAMAARHFRAGDINRVILCSDGVANVGLTDVEDMLERVETYRDYGVTFTSVGFGMGAYNDALLEKLANSGDGSYVFCDSRAEARRVFVEDMAATLQTIAKDAKIQVEFNPRRVRRYRLIGYENRDIADDRFRDDTVDAGEVGSGQSATALYELELLGPRFEGEAPEHLGTVYVRYRNTDTGGIEEISRRMENDIVRHRSAEREPRFFLAACTAEFAEILRASEHAGSGNLSDVEHLLEKVAVRLPLDKRVRELLWLVKRAQGLPRAG